MGEGLEVEVGEDKVLAVMLPIGVSGAGWLRGGRL